MADPKRLIIDADPGIDDTAAIFMALGSPEVQVEAIITGFGNASTEQCTVNALRILEAVGRADIPVYKGVSRPMNFDEPMLAPHIHGDDGLGNTNPPMPKTQAQSRNGVLEIIDRALASPGEITFMGIGRQTNLALAISIEPRVAKALKEIVVMGGAIREAGNASAVATANIIGDPEAADIVYRSGGNVVQIGMDVCLKVEMSGVQQQRVWDSDTQASRFLETATKYINQAYSRANRLDNPDGVQYNDVPAMAYAIASHLYKCQDMYVRVETQGSLTRGQTVPDLRHTPEQPPNVKVAMDVDAAALTELWAERVSGLKG